MKKFRINWKKLGIFGLALTTITAVSLTPFYISNIGKSQNQKQSNNLINIETKEEQIEFFKNYEMAEIESYMSESNIVETIEKQSLGQAQGFSNVSESEIDIEAEITQKIEEVLEGEILIADIENKFLDNLEHNEEYKSEYQDLKDNFIDFNIENNVYNDFNQYDNNESESFSFNGEGYSTNSENTISGEELFQLQELVNYKQNLRKYLDANIAFTALTGTLTVVAWGVAAFYWSAWWMFGANAAFAAAATTQAISLTVTTGFSIATTVDISKELKKIENVIPKSLEFDIKNNYNNLLKKYSSAEIKEMGSISFSVTMGSFTPIPMAINWLGKKALVKTAEFVAKVLKRVIPAKLTNKAIMKATSWANPINWAINSLDFLISLSSFIVDMTIY